MGLVERLEQPPDVVKPRVLRVRRWEQVAQAQRLEPRRHLAWAPGRWPSSWQDWAETLATLSGDRRAAHPQLGTAPKPSARARPSTVRRPEEAARTRCPDQVPRWSSWWRME